MDPARIAALLEPFLGPPNDRRLSTGDLDSISTYIDLLLRWNARINLTAIRDPEEIVPRHFGESFFLARHVFPAASVHPQSDRSPLLSQSAKPIHVLDLGSGAGFPALPIKIWAPDIHLTMIESNHKKATFLREVVRALTLTNVDVIAERAETVAPRLQRPSDQDTRAETGPAATLSPADVVTFRAVEKFEKIVPLAVTFLAQEATLAILIGERQLKELETLESLSWTSIYIPGSQQRVLALGKAGEQQKW